MVQSGKTFRLRVWARAVLQEVGGDIKAAAEKLGEQITAADDAELERALAGDYRDYALRRVLFSALSELEEEGVLPKAREEAMPEAAPRAETWAYGRIRDMAQREEAQRFNYLDDFLVGGEPIGDLTPETVLARADLLERDARFMRLMASGVPPQGRIRDYITPDEAAERWKLAKEPAPQPQRDERREQIMRMLTRGRTMKPDEYRVAQARVEELCALNNPDAWDKFELDALARVMSEYEDEQR